MKRTSTGTGQAILQDPKLWIVFITLAAFGLRIWQLSSIPPGWRDDELINSLVISQKFLDGQWAVYYPDASGHESLYHLFNAGMLSIFGPGSAGIRLLSAILGTLTVPLTYLVANRLFGWKVGLVASAALAASFWSLMYSRIGIRHISLPVFMLGTFYFFLVGLGLTGKAITKNRDENAQRSTKYLVLAGLFMGIGFYTYFASRGVPVIMLAAIVYIWLFYRTTLRDRWKGLLLMAGLALLMAIPLTITLIQQPESEVRVAELAVPLVEARAGNFQPLGQHIKHTLNMFHSDGDEEWLYNIPGRPIFGPFTAIFFWIGVAIAAWYALKPILRMFSSLAGKTPKPSPTPGYEIAGAFLLIWWLVGISPAFISVPAASLGHTIVAQSAIYILVALPLLGLERLSTQSPQGRGFRSYLHPLTILAGLLLILAIAWRDWPDYFLEWPSRGMTRFLYRAEIKELAHYLNEHPELTDFGITSLLAGPWDKIALAIDLEDESGVRPRWYFPERATLLQTGGKTAIIFHGYPVSTAVDQSLYQSKSGETAGAFQLSVIKTEPEMGSEPICFQIGLCLVDANYESSSETLELTWQVASPLDLPPTPLISNPPPPGVYSGSRLLVFSHLLDEEGRVLVEDDGLWIDITTLYPGDRFRQQHWLTAPTGVNPTFVSFGLYDPMTNERFLTEDGRDNLILPVTN